MYSKERRVVLLHEAQRLHHEQRDGRVDVRRGDLHEAVHEVLHELLQQPHRALLLQETRHQAHGLHAHCRAVVRTGEAHVLQVLDPHGRQRLLASCERGGVVVQQEGVQVAHGDEAHLLLEVLEAVHQHRVEHAARQLGHAVQLLPHTYQSNQPTHKVVTSSSVPTLRAESRCFTHATCFGLLLSELADEDASSAAICRCATVIWSRSSTQLLRSTSPILSAASVTASRTLTIAMEEKATSWSTTATRISPAFRDFFAASAGRERIFSVSCSKNC